jgi:hypothetical protein
LAILACEGSNVQPARIEVVSHKRKDVEEHAVE